MKAIWRDGLHHSWQAFWHAPESPVNLAAARIIFAAHALWILCARDLPALSGIPAEFWFAVSPDTHWRFLLWAGHPHLEQWLQCLTIMALCAAVCGPGGRFGCFVAGILLYHLAPLETIIWTPNPFERGFTISVLALLTLSFSRCTDALTIAPWQATMPQPASIYNWPLRLVQLFFCQIYFFAGYSKLFRAGLGWITTANIRAWLLVFSQQDQVRVFHSVGPWIAEHPFLCLSIAIATIMLDLGFIAVLFWKRARRCLIPLALFFHLGILVSMNIAFLNVPQFLIFVDWQTLLQRYLKWQKNRGKKGKGHVHDHACG